jgi:hypothetical protein
MILKITAFLRTEFPQRKRPLFITDICIPGLLKSFREGRNEVLERAME